MGKCRVYVKSLSVVLASLLAWSAAGAEEPLAMLFRDKPPYSYVANGIMQGFLLERTREILDRARVPMHFMEVPPKRIFQDIQGNASPVCSFGWYKIPEREAYAKFSKPIHQDRPHVVLASASVIEAVRKHKKLSDLMADASLSISLADGVSYGPELDRMIAAFPGRIDRGVIPPLQVAKKITARRADFMFIDQEDYDHLMSSSPEFRDEKLVRIEYPDLPAGLKRYILCSQKVSDEVMTRIDASIERQRIAK